MIAEFINGRVRYRGISNADLVRLPDPILLEELARVQRELKTLKEICTGQPRYVAAWHRPEKNVLKSEQRRIEREQAKRLACA